MCQPFGRRGCQQECVHLPCYTTNHVVTGTLPNTNNSGPRTAVGILIAPGLVLWLISVRISADFTRFCTTNQDLATRYRSRAITPSYTLVYSIGIPTIRRGNFGYTRSYCNTFPLSGRLGDLDPLEYVRAGKPKKATNNPLLVAFL